MKTVLYLASTPNGYIARSDDSAPWSDAVWESYAEQVKSAGNMIVGRRTYEIMAEGGDFDLVGSPYVVVVSSQKILSPFPYVECAWSPAEALEMVRQKWFETALVAGGAHMAGAFVGAGLADEVLVDIEPMLFGKGIRFFPESEFEVRLQLMKVKHLSKDTLQVRYKVLS